MSLTDIARYKSNDHSDDLIRNWLRNRNTLEFLGLWEQLNNPDYKSVDFDGVVLQAGLNSFALTPKRWIEATGAIKTNLIPSPTTPQQINLINASEADLQNIALFGKTGQQRLVEHPE